MTSKGYIHSDEVLGVELVGGPGNRLFPLTMYRTKAAVPVGDSILAAISSSNALNSGVNRLILPTQYRPRSLRRFYSNYYREIFGEDGTISAIVPNDTMDVAFYKGTADAFYHALQIANGTPHKYVLGLSGDHIMSKLDFSKLFDVYLKNYPEDAFIIFTQTVPRAEASRFGIMRTEEGGTAVREFTEKPKNHELPGGQETFQASMGIYFAPMQVWRKILDKDQEEGRAGSSEYDIGRNVIPTMLQEGKFPVHVFNFDGYWADVGESTALWEAYRRIFLDRKPDIFHEPGWEIAHLGEHNHHSTDAEVYFESGDFVARESSLNGSIFSPGVVIDTSEVLDSILFGASNGHKTYVHHSSQIRRAIIDKRCDIGPNAMVSSEGGLILVIKGSRIPAGVRIERENAIVGPLDELARYANKVRSYFEHLKKKSLHVDLFDQNGDQIGIEDVVARAGQLGI